VRKTRDGDAVASYRIVRVNNVEVYENLDGVLETILAALDPAEPSPRARGERAG
jgi:very-short-patch-repair endonuclease